MIKTEDISVDANGAGVSNLLDADVSIANPNDVQAYLDGFADLRPLVAAVCVEVRRFFGRGAELALDVYRDPEVEDRFLVLYVRLDRYPATIMDDIEKVCQPFDEARENASGYFLVTTDFRPKAAAHGI